MKTILRFVVLLVGVACLTGSAEAQYFGRNKVQYETFDFRVLQTDHFKVFFYPSERDAAEQAARMAERWYARLAVILQHQLRGKQVLVLYADHPDFEQTNVISDQPSEATGGVTESLKRRIILPLGATLAETDHVLGHELVHAFQYDITGVGGGGSQVVPGVTRLPLWFVEGMAEYLSIGPIDPHTAMWMRDAVRQNKLPKFADLAGYKFFPYRYGQAFWAFLGGAYGDQIVGRALRSAGKSGDVRMALQQLTKRPADSLVADWHAALREAARAVAQVTDSVVARGAPRMVAQASDSTAFGGRPVLGGRGSDSRLNLAPALSPDGQRVAYLSEAGLVSIDVYLADMTTGRPIRKLFSSTRDPDYESLQFVNSAGAWDPAGRRFALGAVARGKPTLTILDVETGRIEREASFPGVGEIFNPTWSPDGRQVAFSAQTGGHTDLFIYDLESRQLRRVTEDAYADLQPAWSPDGRQIAFVTDRFGTSLATLSYGEYRLALVDVASGAVRALPTLGQAKHINPQWSPDGRSLYILSDRGGITNVYRLSLADGEYTQVTNLYTGVSGITALSPALSVAHENGRLAAGVYVDGAYELHSIDDRAVLAGRPMSSLPPMTAVLAPMERTSTGGVAAILRDPRTGLPPDTTRSAEPYRPGFSLDFIAQPSLAIAADRFGTYLGGGATLYWSDMLSDHNLVTMVQASGSFEHFNLAALLAYENRKHRWNWGAALQQTPYLYGGIRQGTGTVDGELAYIEQVEIFRQINRQALGYVAYPFNRVRRVEFQGGVQHISYNHYQTTRAFSLSSGRLILDSTENFPTFGAMMLGTASAALVFDNSYFGATSPILGSRYRLEVSPVVGDLLFTTALADYRHYLMPVRPFTFAGRLLHIGRYGSGADDERIYPLFLGYPSLVRGYDFNSFNTGGECPGGFSDCPVLDQLFGSRLLVGNVEVRFPLFGLLGLGDGYYGFLPIEAALFYDAGVAWTATEGAQIFGGGSRTIVSSTGVTLRMNLFGYAIGQLDYVRPFARPGQDWMVRLSLTPGF